MKLGRRSLLHFGAASALVGGLGPSGRVLAQAIQASTSDVLDVVIVGGGLSGLTTARDLHRAGCESFVVLEARSRVGGRTYNHDLGHGMISEGGGQWIGPGQTAIADLARELEIGTFDTYYAGKTVFLAGDGRVAQDFHGTLGTNLTIAAKLSALSRNVPSGAPWKAPNASALDRMSVGDWLAEQGLNVEDRIGFNIGVNLSGGTAPAKMGLLHYLSMINSANCDYEQLDSIRDSAQQTRFVGGSQLLSIRIAHDLGEKVRLSCPVRKIANWDREIAYVHTDQGIIRARRVVMALSPSLCNQTSFDPPLPSGRAGLQRLWPAHSPGRKTVHVYSRPFWRDGGLNGQIIQVNGPVIWAYDNSPPDGAVGVINAFVMQALLPADPKAAEPILSGIYAHALGRQALDPIQYHEVDWGKIDPWSLSCVSAIPPGFWTKWGEFLHPSVGKLIWSGTETADIWAGYMDGAVRAGHQAALQALNAIAHA